MAKLSFVFYKDWLNTIQGLPTDIQLDLFNAIAEYGINGKEIELKAVSRAVFSLIKQQMERDAEKYDKIKGVRSEAGRRGALKKWQTMANDSKNGNCHLNVNDNVNVNVNEREGEKLPHARKVFSESTYFDKEKFLNARPAGAALWSTVPIHAKEILYTEILAWSHNTHAWRDDDGWILEAYKWYSRNPEKYKVKEAKTIPFKNGASDEIKKAREGLKVFQTN